MSRIRRTIVRKLQWLQSVLALPTEREIPPEGWTCFHCGETFRDAITAEDHFGSDQYEYVRPGCVDRLTYSERELRESLIDMAKELDGERDRSEELEIDSDNLHAEEAELARRFNGARSVAQAWNVLDSMTGRALAAEEIIENIAESNPLLVAHARVAVVAFKQIDQAIKALR